ncbi:MAG TPA: cytochrome c [Vicinamibacterales bacterium]|nr:cytochrome c [Vicinamibacterales bacterium]
MNKAVSIAGVVAVGAIVAAYQLVRPEPVIARHVPITTKIVFNREIAQIFQKKCFQCHTDNNVSVPLTTYREARPWAVAIKEEILERRMPPWGAASGYGHFANDMSLTGREISLILSWADGGAPSGVLLADEDKQPVFIPPLSGWELGAPDATIAVAENQKIAGDTPFRIERFDVNTGLKQPRWIRALQFDPADRRAIRFAAIYDARNGRWLGTWTPSSKVSAMPAGSGVQLPAGAKLTMEIGYRGGMEDASGEGELGLYFADKPPAPASSIEIAPAPLSLAAGKIGERFRAETTIKTPITISSMWPKLGPGGRSIELTAMRPDGSVEPMLWVNNYRAEWPAPYIMKEAITLPAGTRLVMTAYYDNKTDAAIAAKPLLSITAAPPLLRDATAP